MTNPNNEGEADEIVRRLKMPPTRRLKAGWTTNDVLDILSDDLAAAITEEIDKELLEQIRKQL